MRVIHLPTSIGGNSYGLSRGERTLGLQSDVLYTNTNYLDYPCDIRLPADKIYPRVLIERLNILKKLIDHYDVFHYNYGSTLLDIPGIVDLMELPLLENKKIAVTYNGCDARQKYRRIDQTDITMCKYPDCYGGMCNDPRIEKIKEKRISKFERYNAAFFAISPDIMNFLPDGTNFLPCTIVDWENIFRVDTYANDKVFKVVHAPTNRVVKGTEAIITAIKRIKEKYPGKIELILVENMSNEEAKKIYAEATLVVDQLRAGWYGAVAVEAMKMGKPVVAYINEADLHFIPKQMALDCINSIINANEYNIEETILFYFDNSKELSNKKEAQLEYVHRWHNPQYVAGITKKKYEEQL